MTEKSAAEKLRDHKVACLSCNHPSKLMMCPEGERLQNISVDEFLQIPKGSRNHG